MMRRSAPRLASRAIVLPLIAAALAALPCHAGWAAEAPGHRGAHLQVQPGAGSALEPLRLRVEVSHEGFDGRPDLTIEAEQGQRVEITFVWADSAVPDNAHRIYIKGYELKTDLLSRSNPEDTLSFIADRAGTFEVVCDWYCEGHKEALQGGRLQIRPTGAAVAAATALTLAASPGQAQGPVVLAATLVDEGGGPIAGALVRFFVEVEFAGTAGLMEIGQGQTGNDGVASIEYVPASAGERVVRVRFEGSGVYGESEDTMRIEAQHAVPAYAQETTSLDRLRPWTRLGLGVLVLGVWGAFAYVIFQLRRIGRAPLGGGGREKAA